MNSSKHPLYKDFNNAAQVALEQGKSLGCDGVKVVLSTTIEKRLVVENGEFSLANVTDSKNIGVLVYKDQRKGTTSLNATDPASIKRAVINALDLAKFSIPDPALTLARPEETGKFVDLDFIHDPTVARLELEDLQPMMHDALEALISDERLALDRFEMSSSESFQSMATSTGIVCNEMQTSVDWSYLAMARDDANDEVSGMDYDGGFSFALKGARERILQEALAFRDRVLANLKPGKCPSYKGLVIFSPRAVSEILLDPLLYHASGYQVMDGRSRWATSVGKKVMSDKISLVDDPHDRTLEGATSYDNDGIATVKQPIIDRGVLAMHLQSCYSAKRNNTKPNAMAGGPFGLKLAPGDASLEDLYGARKEILFVDRFSGNTDSLTGDFSGVAKTSSLYVNGKRAHAVTEVMIAGNVFTLLEKVAAVSKAVENLSGDMLAPYMLFDEISVSSK